MSILIWKRRRAPDIEVEQQFAVARARPLGVLVWPLGAAATGFLLAATMTILIVWVPIIVLFALSTDLLRRKRIEVGKDVFG
jgi:hypothetical protein